MRHRIIRSMLVVILLGIYTHSYAYNYRNSNSTDSLSKFLELSNESKIFFTRDNIELLIPTKLKKLLVTGEEIYYQESSESIPYTIKTRISNISKISILLQNTITTENTLIAKYTLSSDFGGELSGRLKHRCKSRVCRVFVAVTSDKSVYVTSKLIGNAIAH